MTDELLEGGCQCPNGHPPCSFCTEMDEDEAEIYCSEGYAALVDWVKNRKEIEEHNIW